MKRSEMVGHIMDELQDFLECWEHCSDKRKPYYLKYRAEGVLDFMEGFGMLPPKLELDPKGPWDDRMFGWETEDD